MAFIPIIHSCLCLCLILPRATGQVSREEHRQFADSLTSELYTNLNECTSSWGVSMLFDLLRPGSSGTTSSEICDVMGLCGPEQELLWNDTVHTLTAEYDGRCLYQLDASAEACDLQSPTLKVANSIWIDNSSQLQSNYSDAVGDYLLQTNFSSQDAGGTVNKWVNSSTLGLIDSVIDEGPIPYDLVAINSIYLRASWKNPFSEERTNEDLFYTDASRVEALPGKAHFMHTVGDDMPYSEELLPGYQIIALKYQSERDGELSMVVVLPVVAGAASVSSDEVLQALPLLESRRVALALPKFRVEAEYKENLQMALKSLGLAAPFDPKQGFCGLLEGELCHVIDLLIQKTFIEVDENGTIAAAVTMAGVVEVSLPLPDTPALFLADHPFQFFIYDAKEDLVLFEGRVGAPSIPSDWPPAQFQPKHSDPDFWTGNFYGVEGPPVQPTPASTMGPETLTSTTQRSTVDPETFISTTQSPEEPVPSSALIGNSDMSASPNIFAPTCWTAVAVVAAIVAVAH